MSKITSYELKKTYNKPDLLTVKTYVADDFYFKDINGFELKKDDFEFKKKYIKDNYAVHLYKQKIDIPVDNIFFNSFRYYENNDFHYFNKEKQTDYKLNFNQVVSCQVKENKPAIKIDLSLFFKIC